MANGRNYRGNVKRRIEQITGTLNFTTGSSTTGKVLHAAEDSKTLVRVILNVRAHPLSYTSSGTIYSSGWTLGVEPNSIVVVNPSIGESLDDVKPDQMLAQGIVSYTGSGAGTTDHHRDTQDIVLDIKGMRKLKGGDEIVLRTLGEGVGSTHQFIGSYTLVFKE